MSTNTEKRSLFIVIPSILGTLAGLILLPETASFVGLHAHKLKLIHVPSGSVTFPPDPDSAASLPKTYSIHSFYASRTEIQVRTFSQFLSRYPELLTPYTGQVIQCHGRIRPAPGFARKPVTHVSLDDAQLFCQWLSEVSGRRCRLPTPEEWIYLAGSGHPGVPHPWGWEPASRRATFDQTGPKNAGFYGSSGFGMTDLIGNVYEWSLDPHLEKAFIHGGGWSDRHEFSMKLHQGYEQSPSCRSADIGFRVLIEMPAFPSPVSLTSTSKAL